MSDTPQQTPGQDREAPPTASAPPAEGRKEHSGGVTLGILLILIGIAIVVGRYVPGLSIVNAWPLIIVVLGLARIFRSKDVHGVLDGLTSVLIGGVLLMNTIGWLPWEVWLSILSLWPLLLVSAGVAIIGKAVSQAWLRVAAQAIIIGGLLYGAFVMPAGSFVFPFYVRSIDQGPMAAFEEAVVQGSDEATVTRGTATVGWGAAAVKVVDGAGIARVSGTAPRRAQPQVTHETADGRTDVSVGVPGVGGAGPDGRLDVVLGRDVRWESIALSLGGTDAEVDLRLLEVDRLELNTGASDTTIMLGDRSPTVSVRVNAGVANVLLRVPRDAAVSVRYRGLMATDVPAGFSRAQGGPLDGVWESDPAGASTRIDAVVSGGIMKLEVETY